MRNSAWRATAVAAFIVATGICVVPPVRAEEYSPSDTTKVVILSSGTPLPDLHRRGPAVAVIANGRPYMITISGDTVPCEGIETASRNTAVLVREVYCIDGLKNAPWGGDGVESKKKAMSLYHTSTEELAQFSNKVRPGLLVLYHEQNYTDDPEANVKEIRRFGYCGPVVSSNDQDIF